MMKDINKLANVPEISKTIMNVQMQMEQAGMVNEMIDDAMEDVDDDIDVDDNVEKLINETEDRIIGPKKKTQQTQQQTDFEADIDKLAL